MLKKLWYNFVKIYVRIGFFFLTKKISLHGKENIPKKGAILFMPNHQNALLDAILIPTNNSRNTHFLTRAGVFKNKRMAQFFDSLNMLPIYRVRDGINTIEKNQAVFEKCYDIFNQQKAIEIFAEGEHHLERRVIPLKKGFARIILGALKKYPGLDIKIVPVGINYDSHLAYPCSISIYYGEPISANKYFDSENQNLKYKEIISDASEAMKKLTLNIDDVENYDAIIKKLEANGVDYLNPFEANEMLKNIDSLPNNPKKVQPKTNWFAPLQWLFRINSFIPLMIWKKLRGGIKDIVFTNTFRFALITTLFPLFYLIQSVVVYFFSNLKYALIYLVTSIILGIISTKTTPINRESHLE